MQVWSLMYLYTAWFNVCDVFQIGKGAGGASGWRLGLFQYEDSIKKCDSGYQCTIVEILKLDIL